MKALPPKVVIVGSANVGKTSLLTRYRDSFFNPESVATIGCEVLKKEYVIKTNSPSKSETFSLNFWDTAGQELYGGIAQTYYRNALVGIFVFSMDDPKSVDLAKRISDFCLAAKQNARLILAGNKCDIASKVQKADVDKAIRDAKKRVQQEGGSFGEMEYFGECSAKTGKNVDKLFDKAVRHAYCLANNLATDTTLDTVKPYDPSLVKNEADV